MNNIEQVENDNYIENDDDDWEQHFQNNTLAPAKNKTVSLNLQLEAQQQQQQQEQQQKISLAHARKQEQEEAEERERQDQLNQKKWAKSQINANYGYLKHENDAFEDDYDADYDTYDLERYDKLYNQHIKF